MSSLHGLAQKFVAKANKTTVGVGERFQISYDLEGGDGKRFVQPTFNGFRLLSGPNTSSNMQWVNGQFSSSQSYSFILLAEKEGEFLIDDATIEVKGQKLSSGPLNIKVIQGRTTNQPQQHPQHAQQAQQSATPDDLSSNLFMKLFLDKKEAYVGEQIIATYKLYINAQVINYANNRPVFNGFYAQDVEIDPNTNMTSEVINGRQFRVATMKKVVLTPQTTGDIEVPPLEMEMAVRVQDQPKGRSIFDQFFGSYRNVKVEVNSNAEKVKIKPLPRNEQPGDFGGAVGKYSLNVKTDRTEVNVNEAVNLTVTIEGKGNIELIAVPEIEFPQDFETYEPKVKQNISINGSGTSGKKTFEYVVIPRYAGDFELEPITMSYFDPQSGKYKRLDSEPVKLHVNRTANSNSSNDVAYMAPKKEDVQILGKDIRFIKQETSELKQHEDSFFGTTGFYALSTLPVAGMGLAVLLISGIRRRDSDLTLVKSRKARSMAKKRLAHATKLINGNDKEFYEEIFKALYGYLSDKFSIPVSELNKETIDEHLKGRGIAESLATELRKALDECEMARFAPGVVRGKPDMLEASASIIEKLEDEA
ncbi:MAG: BatD family protein [Flavobacteriales bacterium]